MSGNDGFAGEGLIRVIATGISEQGTTVHEYQNISAVNTIVKSSYHDGWEDYLIETLEWKLNR